MGLGLTWARARRSGPSPPKSPNPKDPPALTWILTVPPVPNPPTCPNPSHLSQTRQIPLPSVRPVRGEAGMSGLVVITLVFLTLLTVLVVIGIYLYRNQGSYLTYEQPESDATPREEPPAKDKEEYFI
uniref:Small cell adhesion glycoprotein n=1 Tax=Zonotrichia albicollis TaxID=44394 RepID=A0A8D2QC39_ZONAL